MKMNLLLPVFFSAIIFNSCSQYYYTPNSENVPLLSKQNEFIGAANLYPASEGTCVELQTAFAASSHFGFQLNFGGGAGSDNSTIPDIFNGGNGETTNAHGGGGYFEGGAGYFRPFGLQKKFVFETYGLFSLGWMNTTYISTGGSETNGSINAGITRLAIQPSIGYKVKHFEIAFSLRAGNIHYSHITGTLVLDSKNQQNYLSQNKNQFFIEPALIVKAGGRCLKGQLQMGSSTDETNPSFNYVHSLISLGLNFNIYEMKKDNKIKHDTKTTSIPPSL